KGAYAKALSGEFKNFPGVDEVYEEPQHAEIVIDTQALSVDEAAALIVEHVKKNYMK
ncbi:MAG: adenylyl-sulfate kinase, partial [Methylophilaceae bacterium]